MTFLELVNTTRRECGASGPPLLTLGGSLSYENTRIKNWVLDAYRELQTRMRDWGFMQREFSFITTPGIGTYTAATLSTPLPSFANWKTDSLRCYTQSLGFPDEQVLPFRDYMEFRDLYLFGANRTLQQRPVLFTVDPNKNLLLGPLPDQAYVVNGLYYLASQTMVADSDEPTVIPEEFQDVIVYGAMMKYGYYEAAPEALARGTAEWDRQLNGLMLDYLPKIVSGPTLA